MLKYVVLVKRSHFKLFNMYRKLNHNQTPKATPPFFGINSEEPYLQIKVKNSRKKIAPK